MYQRSSKLLFFIIILAIEGNAIAEQDDSVLSGDVYCDGSGWIPFRDEKCYKLIKKWASRNDAKDMCAQEFLSLDSSLPQLAAIKSVGEQNFLTSYNFNESGVEINVWTGAKRVPNSNQFVWDDGSSIEEYTNWANGSPSENDKGACVVMQSEVNRNQHEIRRANGTWRDVSCESPNYVLCEKLPRWSIGKLQQTLVQVRKQLLATEDELTATKTDLAATKTDLNAAKIDLTKAKSDLAATKTDLDATKTDLAATKTDLAETKTELTETKTDQAATKSDLADTKTNLTAAKSDLAATKTDLASTKANITATATHLTETKTELTATKTELTQTKNRVTSVESNPVPHGFIYVQLSNQPQPATLWPALLWQDVTVQYAGLFFRAEGGGSAQFGSIQAENAPRVTNVRYKFYGNEDQGGVLWGQTTLVAGQWSTGTGVFSGSYSSTEKKFHTHQFLTSDGEVRPRNMAMRFWKRI